MDSFWVIRHVSYALIKWICPINACNSGRNHSVFLSENCVLEDAWEPDPMARCWDRLGPIEHCACHLMTLRLIENFLVISAAVDNSLRSIDKTVGVTQHHRFAELTAVCKRSQKTQKPNSPGGKDPRGSPSSHYYWCKVHGTLLQCLRQLPYSSGVPSTVVCSTSKYCNVLLHPSCKPSVCHCNVSAPIATHPSPPI